MFWANWSGSDNAELYWSIYDINAKLPQDLSVVLREFFVQLYSILQKMLLTENKTLASIQNKRKDITDNKKDRLVMRYLI
jgi:hypothetical protein